MTDTQKLADTLAIHDRKLTRGRVALYRALAESDSPLSNRQLIERLPGLDKVTVYRTLDLFENIGITHRIWNGFKSAVELSETFSAHHHHFTCSRCGSVASFKSDGIEQAINREVEAIGVTITGHVIELRGTCRLCR